jgi:hypothetical protein
MIEQRPGQIITFYSYKGGTGRSMALANIAWVLASNGKRVLVVDWDLEAPGLHRYFAPFLIDSELTATNGLIDLVTEFAVQAATPRDASLRREGWHEQFVKLDDYVVSLDWNFDEGGCLDLFAAGRQGATYAARVNAFNWESFYRELGGGVFLESLRQAMRREYDYVLIDSRTGVSDTAGICTVQMPDVLVVLFTPNNQSIHGSAAVAKSVAQQWAGDEATRTRRILPVMTRLDNAEKDKLDVRRQLCRAQFDAFLKDRSRDQLDEYWGKTSMPYIPWYSYEEVLAPFADKPGDPSTLIAACEALTAQITERRVTRLKWPEEADRLRVREQFLRESEKRTTFDAFLSYSEGDRAAVEQVYRYLRDVAKLRCWFDVHELAPGMNVHETIADAVRSARWVVDFIGSSRTASAGSTSEHPTIPVLLPNPQRTGADFATRLHPVDMSDGISELKLYQLECAIRGMRPDPAKLEELRARAAKKRLPRLPVAITVSVAAVAAGTGVYMFGFHKESTTPPSCDVTSASYKQLSDIANEHWCSSVNALTRPVECVSPMQDGGKVIGTCLRGNPVYQWSSLDPGARELWSGLFDNAGLRTGDWHMEVAYDGEYLPAVVTYKNGASVKASIRRVEATLTSIPGIQDPQQLDATCRVYATSLHITSRANPVKAEFSIEDAKRSYSGSLSDGSPTGIWRYREAGIETVLDVGRLSEPDRVAWSELVAGLRDLARKIPKCSNYGDIDLPAPHCSATSPWTYRVGCVTPGKAAYAGPCAVLRTGGVLHTGDSPALTQRLCTPSPGLQDPALEAEVKKRQWSCSVLYVCDKQM